jgi:hypothetical protein
LHGLWKATALSPVGRVRRASRYVPAFTALAARRNPPSEVVRGNSFAAQKASALDGRPRHPVRINSHLHRKVICIRASVVGYASRTFIGLGIGKWYAVRTLHDLRGAFSADIAGVPGQLRRLSAHAAGNQSPGAVSDSDGIVPTGWPAAGHGGQPDTDAGLLCRAGENLTARAGSTP